MAQSLNTLITLQDPRSSASEAFRTLRTNIEFSSLDHPLRSLLVTSPAETVDTATTLANLAVIMTEGGRKVILIEGDLHKPSLHTLFDIENANGLGNLVAGEALPETLPVQESGIPGLQILPSGTLPPNPSVLLGGERMKAILDTLSKQADMVLLSAPPILAVTDAALLAAQVDGTLLVLRAGETEREHAEQAKLLLEKVNARLIGAVLTNAGVDGALSGYYKRQVG